MLQENIDNATQLGKFDFVSAALNFNIFHQMNTKSIFTSGGSHMYE